MKQLFDYIEKFTKLSTDAKLAIERLAITEHFSRNQFILEPGQRCHKIWLLTKGMVRKYHLAHGKEVTTWIHIENEIFTALQSYGEQTASDEYIQACEDSEAISISRNSSIALSCFPELNVFSNELLRRAFLDVEKATKILNQKDAKGKYRFLVEFAPEMVKKAKLGHIASILGITQETLSRIRKG